METCCYCSESRVSVANRWRDVSFHHPFHRSHLLVCCHYLYSLLLHYCGNWMFYRQTNLRSVNRPGLSNLLDMAGCIDFILGVAVQYAVSATIKAGGYFRSFHQMAPTVHSRTHLIPAHYLFIDPERMKGWVGLVVWPVTNGLPTHQLQVEHRQEKARRQETDVLPLCNATTHNHKRSVLILKLEVLVTAKVFEHVVLTDII